MNASGLRCIAVAALCLCAGCAARGPLTWRVEGQTLIPPGRPRAVALKTRGDCPAAETIAVARKGGRTVLTVNAGVLARQAPGWLATWSWRAEESGCVPRGEWLWLAERVLESAPLPLGGRYRLLHPDHARSGYVDLGAENRLEVIAPILREGADPTAPLVEAASVSGSSGGLTIDLKASPGLLGVETTWYAVRNGAIDPVGTPPRRNIFAGSRARFWRLVYKADQSSMILAADSRREIEEATIAIRDRPEECPRCIAVPRSVAVNPYVAVTVNGSEVRVPVGSTLGAVLRAAGRKPEQVMATLAISKPYDGRMTPVKFERAKPDVMGLVMEGNEMIRW